MSELKSLAGQGWVTADPPSVDAPKSVIGIVDGVAIRAPPQFELDKSPVTETPSEVHRIFRAGKYNVHLRLHTAGDIATTGEVKVVEAPGYE